MALYALEPTVRDVFVEGQSDRDLMIWYLRESNFAAAKVYNIDLIDVPREFVQKHGYSSGNRQRVITLAMELAEHLGAIRQATCIIDADLDRLLAVEASCPILFRTDYANMDAYLFCKSVLEKFFTLGLGLMEVDIDEIIDNYIDILRELFIIRCAAYLLARGISWVDVEKSFSVENGMVSLNRGNLIQRLLHNSRAWDYKDEIERQVEVIRQRVGDEPRHIVHGHDFLALLSWHFRAEAGKRGLKDKRGIRTALVTCISLDEIRVETLFRVCSDRCAN